MLREKIDQNETVYGTWCEIPVPYAVNIIASAGMDFVIVDMEHGVMEFEQLQNMVFAAHCEGCGVLVRVPCIAEEYVLRALDTGADGIVFPQVEKKEDIESIVRFGKYPPMGERGFNPYIKAGGYAGVGKEYFKQQNDRLLTGIILEGERAFAEIGAILEEDSTDIVYIGQYDLSVALGVPGDVNHPKVLEMLDMAVTKIRSRGKYAGCMVHNAREAQQARESGVNFIVYKVDSGVLFEAYHSFMEEAGQH